MKLRAYVDVRLADLIDRVTERFALNDSSVAKAERTMNERLNSMNEFRDALKDQANRMATRLELERVEADVNELRRAKANFDGRMVIVSGGISLAVTVVLWALGRFVP